MKWTVIAVCAALFGFAEFQETSARVECLAGSKWSAACQECACSEKGLAVCKKSSCKTSETVLSDPGKCAPNTSWTDECNYCHCSENGLSLCTKRHCIKDIDAPSAGTSPDPTVSPPSSKEPELLMGHDCEPGTTWQNQCNNCFCTPSGYAGCTEIGCPADSGPQYQCKPDSRWKDDCNTCFCNSDGAPICTRIGCGDLTHKIPEMTFIDVLKKSAETSTLPTALERTCRPGESFHDGCNRCYCGNDHRFTLCTKKACFRSVDETKPTQRYKREAKKVCEPGKRFKKECNSCQCNEDGSKFWCTKVGCLVAAPDFASVARVYDANARLKREACSPNNVLQHDECNTCKCDPDGAGYTCTQNECMDKIGDVEVFMENEGRDHIERNSVCQPSSTFDINCNTCQCNDDGTDYRCTNKVCPLPEDVELFRELKDETHIVPLKKCEPNGILLDACNECRCSDGGHGADFNCNKTKCKGKGEGRNSRFKDEEGKSILNRTIVCQANKAFQKDCNTCWCNDDGTGYFCTRKVCVPNLPDDGDAMERPEELRIIERDCRPHEVFEVDCNMCRCNEDGKSFSCTRRACVTDAPTDAVDYESKNSGPEVTAATLSAPTAVKRVRRGADEPAKPTVKACEPGEKFRVDCNTCLCHTDGGSFACTRNNCHQPQQPEQSAGSSTRRRRRREVGKQDVDNCEPGSVFDQDCNVCRCSSDGRHATCTLKRCQNIPPDDKKKAPEPETGFRCTPGEQFKRACNDCTCSADGKSVFCTIKLCEKEIASQL